MWSSKMRGKASAAILCLSFLFTPSLAAPKPKAPWVQAARSRLAKSGNALSRRWANTTTCAQTGPAAISAPAANIWVGLTDDEAASITSWLFHQADLNLTISDKAGEWDNTVLLVELQPPNKTLALAYIDGGGPEPQRYAHVVLDRRATAEPTYSDILVGPLPIVNGTTIWQPLEFDLTRKTGGSVRNLDASSDTQSAWIHNITGSISDITMNLWGGFANGSDAGTLDVWGIDPLWQDEDDGNSKLTYWATFWNHPVDEMDAETLLPLGLFLKADVTGRDPAQWKFEGWLYNDIFYPTTDAFRTAFYSPGFVKLGANVEGDWARTDRNGEALPMDTNAPPQMIAPGGSRYAVDQESKYVSWMGWSFYIGFTRDRGLALFDIRYEGERILYELGLQEALAHYAGNDPVQSGVGYLDTYCGFGPYAFQLVPGYDCPSYASYLNTSFYVDETTHTHINSICLFEFDADYPMQRHSTGDYVANTKNVYFTVRSVSTIGNYDYMTSYEFFLDGSIKVEVRASGYIQSAYYANNHDYGYQIHDSLSGSMHDHVLNFKADFDILGTANTMELTTVIPTTESYVWSDKPRNTMKLARRFIENEDDSRLNYDANAATQYRIINTAAPNAYGEYRGYRILPESTIHLTVQNSTNLANAANLFSHDLAVTQAHDSEPRAAHPYNGQDIHNPPIDFAAFFDGENLVQEDLVVWLNLGMHHVPHTGDLPNTVFTTAHSAVHFMPLNYFDEDVSRRTVNQVRIDYDGEKSQEQELWKYTGDVVIRKFPYDPNDPYFESDSIV
ncbi:Membrane primary amine oxidase [Pseudocercospora fuligena]|uniref:Amine oxidase n=1 Tax=Pseudocercospora fuligena TaxID=685502 RepID=A0A8H6RST3_9PEZI|nr:Membrane primary amine oxidase [Pseudocercospora fuligena]